MAVKVLIHPHTQERLIERGATEEEVLDAVEFGEMFPAKLGRTGFRRNFHFSKEWRGKVYGTKQVEVFAVETEKDDWLAITVIVKYY